MVNALPQMPLQMLAFQAQAGGNGNIGLVSRTKSSV